MLGTNTVESHTLLCPGLRVEIDRYSTGICPKCKISGFGPAVISRHIRKCKGSQRDTIQSYAKGQPIYRCEGCKDYFLKNGLRTHTCGVIGDPVWLGESGPPDLSVSYIRWCRDHNLTLGGSPGRMPDAVPDTTISVFAPTVHGSSGVGEGRSLEPDEDDLDGDESAEEDEFEGSVKDGDDASAEREPRETLAAAGISFGTFEPAACPGVVWRHGYFACPFDETITVDNVRLLHVLSEKGKGIQMCDSCWRCAGVLRRIRKWIGEGKYTPEGVQICRRTDCTEPTMAVWHCRFHADQRTGYNHSVAFRHTSSRAIPPEAMVRFLARLRAHPSKLVSPAWSAVRNAIRDPQPDGPKVFFVDTESVYDRVAKIFLVCEIALVSAQGDLVFHSLVDHGLSFRELRERVDSALWSKLSQLYRFEDLDAVTTGQTADEVGNQLLKLGMCPDAHLVEWSLNGFDLRAMRGTFASHASFFPRTSLLGHQLWRALGLKGGVALQALFYSYQPTSPLNRTHHEAPIDAAKLFMMVDGALQRFA